MPKKTYRCVFYVNVNRLCRIDLFGRHKYEINYRERIFWSR